MGKRPAQTDLQKTKSKRARRILQAREPKEVSSLSVAELPGNAAFVTLEMKVRFWCDACRLLQVEDAKKTLLLAGNKTSQVVKDILSDMQKLEPLVRLRNAHT